MDFVFSLPGVLTILLVAVLWARARGARPGRWRVVVGVLVFYALTGTYAVPYAISRVLVWGYAPLLQPADVKGRTVIIVLGAGQRPISAWDGTAWPMNNAASAARVAEARRVYGLYPDAIVIASGGATIREPRMTSAGVIRNDLMVLGVPVSRIVLEERSLNTRDEAVQVAPMLPALRPDRVVIVTSDIHMRRSMGAFRAVGIDGIPAIARDPYMGLRWHLWALPSFEGVRFAAGVLHEFVGLAYYRLQGWLK